MSSRVYAIPLQTPVLSHSIFVLHGHCAGECLGDLTVLGAPIAISDISVRTRGQCSLEQKMRSIRYQLPLSGSPDVRKTRAIKVGSPLCSYAISISLRGPLSSSAIIS